MPLIALYWVVYMIRFIKPIFVRKHEIVFNAAILHQKLAKNGKLFLASLISVKEQHSIKMLK
jgi:hypothetical protein